ncbi:GtrA-like protein [Rubritalea squalenifaciens DSM 18772]|uniref:GtrA-like protein n=1 Tax=Rubritalea squalenifaciens DSM 18772 TaxID=1123071 RepID=A0A1M6IJY2_9BACT|nr:GtrA family protein [Rubritalea squalenifaciens]SHJ34801.1 GtrA-like protein [Rubritalea squalenifaciens DSM 18772]
MASERKHSLSIVLPVLGEVPLQPRIIFQELKLKEGPLWAQFFKYAFCGVLSMIVLLLVVQGFRVFAPEYMSDDLPIEVKQVNVRWVLFAAFIPSNLFAYFTNRFFVFTPGKHDPWRELMIFTLVSAISFCGGEVGKMWMINAGYPNLVAVGAFAVSSALVNFIARKFLVFAR